MKRNQLILLFSIAASPLLAQPVLKQPRVFDDLSIQLHWQSETGAVYEVQSVGNLSAVDQDGNLAFIPREQRIVSQGTNTTWLDYGDPTALNRILHPADRPHRFYRVRQVAQSTNAPVSISIVAPTNNATVSSNLIVEVTVNTTNQVGWIRLYVDGQRVDEETDVDSFQFSINTCEWINGDHVIHATVELATSGETTGGAGDDTSGNLDVGCSAPITLHFDNLIQDFTIVNPFFDPFDPSFPEEQIVYANLVLNCDWSVEIVDENENTVKMITGTGTEIYGEWDGSDGFNNFYPPGYYDYILTAAVIGGGQSSEGEDTNSPPSDPPPAPGSLQSTESGSAIEGAKSFVEKPIKNGYFSIPLPIDSAASSALAHRAKRVPWFVARKAALKANEAARGSQLMEPELPPLPPGMIAQLSANPSFQKTPAVAKSSIEPTTLSSENLDAFQPAVAGSQTNQTTRDPHREPGRTQMSFVGVTGAGSQGHHPKTAWAYGPLQNATAVAKGFIDKMAQGAKSTKFPSWRNNFHLIDDALTKTNLVGAGKTPQGINSLNSKFNSGCNIGILAGHTVEYNPPGWPSGTFGSLASYPLYNSSQNTNGYTWVPDAEMRFGSQFLKWMGYYGCNALTQTRWAGGVKERGFWPMSASLNVYLATGSTIYIYPTMGRLWAQGLQGELNGTPMTVINAWVEAGRRAHAAENESRRKRGKPLIDHTVIMSYLYWDARQESGAYTLTDRFQPFSANFSLAGRSVENLHFDKTTVYTPQ